MINRTQENIIQNWPKEWTVPTVSVRCITYNHEKYISDALDGILAQQTSFPFEIVIHDDASTDKTASIIHEYESKYPKIIKAIYQSENQYSKHDGSIARIMQKVSVGKYIALCEGDDYWINPLKLQHQVDFLDKHPDFSMCFTGAKVVSPYKDLEDSLYDGLEERAYSSDEIYEKWIVPTASVLFRGNIKRKDDPDFLFADIVLFLSAAESGYVWRFNEKMVVYRRLPSGMTFVYKHATDKSKIVDAYIRHHIALEKNFPRLSKKCCIRVQAPFFFNKCIVLFRMGKYLKFIGCLLFSLYTYKLSFIMVMSRKIKRFLKILK